MNAGTTIIAFIEDPDGYPIELLEDRWTKVKPG